MTRYVHERNVLLGDTDAIGIVYFSRFFDFAHEAFEHFLAAQQHSIRSMLDEGAHLSPITKAECVYKSPARLGDTLCITVRISATGESTMQSAYAISQKATDKLVAEVSIAHTFIAKESWKKIPIPEEIKRSLSL